jgi:hypothetical protein
VADQLYALYALHRPADPADPAVLLAGLAPRSSPEALTPAPEQLAHA